MLVMISIATDEMIQLVAMYPDMCGSWILLQVYMMQFYVANLCIPVVFFEFV